jgi:RNA polymerase sigma-70 factor (ECF subfamily)
MADISDRVIDSKPSTGPETTASLLKKVRGGDQSARERLMTRCLPALQRWAHGQLPRSARDVVDTNDLVQETLTKALGRIGEFEPRREGAFLAYLRQILLNKIRKQVRRASRNPQMVELPDDVDHGGPSPLEEILGLEALQAYESTLATLPAELQEAITLRIELRFSHQQVAEALGYPSADAARMQVARAVMRLAEAMRGRR